MLNTLILGITTGMFLVLVGPSLLSSTRYGQPTAQKYFRFALKALKRPAVGVGKHGDLSLRQLSFDETFDQETIEVGGVEKKITRTAKNVHRVGSVPFTFMDEVYGATFDLRDVLIGRLEHRLQHDGQMVHVHKEFDDRGMPTRLDTYVRAFFELEGREGLDLDLDESVRPIIDGSEKADWWEYMHESVRRMYRHRQEEMAIMKMLLPFMVTGAALFIGYYIFGPGTMPFSDSSGGGSPVTIGLLVLLATPAQIARGKRLGVALLGVVAVAGVVGGAIMFGAVFSLVVFIGGVLVGMALLPMLALLLGGIGFGGVMLADLLLWAGLAGIDDPLIDLTEDDRYVLRSVDDVDLENPPRMKLSKRLVALSCEVSPKAFGQAGYQADGLIDFIPDDDLLLSDGGEDAVLPRGYCRGVGLENAGHTGFVPRPDRLSDTATYVRTDTWLARFKDAATGDGVDIAEQEATKEYAAGDPKWDDGDLMKFSAFGAFASIGFWVVVALVF